MSNLVVHVPHASLHIPEDVYSQFQVDRGIVDEEADVSADKFTDRMAKEAWPEAVIVAAGVSRVVVDVERYADDAYEAMSKVGRGVIYTHDHKMEPMHRRVGEDARGELISRFYKPHWENLRRVATDATLIDLHTYPFAPWPVESSQNGTRPEIDIGFTEGLTPPNWVKELTSHFQYSGYIVGHNSPYAGVIDAGAKASVMIEIRRDVVGNPGSSKSWQRLIKTLKTIPMPN